MNRRSVLIGTAASFVVAGCNLPDEPPEPRKGGRNGGSPKRTPGPDPDQGTPGEGQMKDLEAKVDGLDRFSKLYVPSSYDGKTAVPLLLGTHGNGGKPSSVFTDYGWQDVCEKEGWLGLFPFSGVEGRPDSKDNEYFDHLMKQVTDDYNVDAGRIWGTGFSGGCYRQYAFAVKHSWVSAIGVSSGAISHGNDPQGENPLKTKAVALSVMHFHGLKDGTIPFKGGDLMGKDGVQRPLLAVREALNPWVKNISGKPAKNPKLPAGCPSSIGLKHYRWDGDDGFNVHVVVDPNLGHNWPRDYATEAITAWFKTVPKRA